MALPKGRRPAAKAAAASSKRQSARDDRVSIETYVPHLINRVAIVAVKGASGEFQKRGLTVPKYRILLAVSEHQGLHFRDLADLTSIERPTLSRLLDEMESAGLLRRVRDPEDSRSVNISLAAAGHARLESTMPWAAEVERDILKGISRTDIAALRRMLGRIFVNLKEREERLHSETHAAARAPRPAQRRRKTRA